MITENMRGRIRRIEMEKRKNVLLRSIYSLLKKLYNYTLKNGKNQ
jgi:hypothetical protein